MMAGTAGAGAACRAPIWR